LMFLPRPFPSLVPPHLSPFLTSPPLSIPSFMTSAEILEQIYGG
jgi:hypothetical protein